MKILFVTPRVNNRGGVENWTLEMAKRFQGAGNEVSLLVFEADNVPVGIKIVRVKNLPGFLGKLCYPFILTYKTIREKRRNKIDLVISTGSSVFWADINNSQSCHLMAVKKLNFFSLKELGFGGIVISILRFISPFNLITFLAEFLVSKLGSKVVVPASIGVGRELKKIYHLSDNKIRVVQNGVDLDYFKRDAKAGERVRKELGISKKELVLIFVGHEFKRKGLYFVIESLSLIKRNDAKLLVLGNDNPQKYAALAKKLGVDDKIIFLGMISKDINNYYSAADMFVMPTAYEAFSLVTLEAQACSLPILVTKVNGTDELVNEGVNGFFVERSGRDLADKINKIVDDKMLLKMKKESRKMAEKYSWTKCFNGLVEIIKSIKK